MSFLVVSRSFILKDFSVMLYSYFSPHAKSWSAQVYPGTPTFSLQPKNIKFFGQQLSAAGRFLCSEGEFVLFHRRQYAQIALHTSGVVVMDIVLNRLNKLPLTCEPSAIIAFPL